MLFKYSGIDKQGKKVKGVLEAKDLQDAKRRLQAQKILYTSLQETNVSSKKRIKLFKRNFTKLELATISRDLAIYLRAGIPILNALKLAKNQYIENKKIQNFIETLITLLNEGKSLYQALEEQSFVDIPTFYKQSIKVAEQSGTLEDVLFELANFLKEQDRINKQIQSAFAYPLFITIISIFMIGFMMAYVVPKITSIFTQMKQQIPTITQIVIVIGDFIAHYWKEMGIVLVILMLLFIITMKLSKKFRYFVDYILLKIPFIGQIIRISELARFSYMISVLIKSGVPFVQSIKLASNIINNTVIQSIFEVASTKVVEGTKLSTALVKYIRIIPPSFVQAVALGEETSQVVVIFQNLTDLYNEENRDKISIFLSLLEPVLMLVVGGIVGFIVTAMLLPIFSINIQG